MVCYLQCNCWCSDQCIKFAHFHTELTQLDEHFSQFCNCSCDDYQFTLEKLKGLPQLSIEDHQQLGAVISSSCDVQLVNEKIFTFLIVKLCYNGSSGGLAGLCDVMDNLIGSGKSTGGVPQGRVWYVILGHNQKFSMGFPDLVVQGSGEPLIDFNIKCYKIY